jgi:flagellar basal-body rod protein FlgC
MFEAMNNAGSGLTVYQTWLDSLSNNIANINTVRPASEPAFQAEFLQAQAVGGQNGTIGQGVETAGLKYSSTDGRLSYDPTNPIADEGGYVRLPDVDLGQQMGDLIMAQRAFQANAAVVDHAHDQYEAAIDIVRKS